MKKKEGFAIGTLDKSKTVVVPVAIAFFTDTAQGNTTPAGTIVWDTNATQPAVSVTSSLYRTNSPSFLNTTTYATNAEITEYVNAGGAISTGSSLVLPASTAISVLFGKTYGQSLPAMSNVCKPIFLKMTLQAYETARDATLYTAINSTTAGLRNPYDSYLLLSHFTIPTANASYIIFNIGPPRTLRTDLKLLTNPTIPQQAE